MQVIKEVKLWEYSAVTWGANENTPVVGMKSHGATPEDADKIFEMAIATSDIVIEAIEEKHADDPVAMEIAREFKSRVIKMKIEKEMEDALNATGEK